MIKSNPVRIVIPTWNNEKDIDSTVHSIIAQDYDPQKIFISFVDLGSTDNTIEKLYSYPPKNIGIFTATGRPKSRTTLADAVRMLGLQSCQGKILPLWPGDILYSHCLRISEKWLQYLFHQRLGITTLVSDIDIKLPDGTVQKQPPLYSKACMLRSFSSDSDEYTIHGFNHQIMTYNLNFTEESDKIGIYQNYIPHWNQMLYYGLMNNIAYTHEVVGCYKQFIPLDALDDLLFRYEYIISIVRGHQENPDLFVLTPKAESNYRFNLAEYAIRSAYSAYKQGHKKTAEDCFLMARIIDKRMKSNIAWQQCELLLNTGQAEHEAWLESWIKKTDAPRSPKLPLGGMLARLKRQWKIWRETEQSFLCTPPLK